MPPTRTLHLLRHAKSSWADDSLPDEERPLAPRGRRATGLLSKHFESIGLDVDLVICSPAQRTRQTWDGVRAAVQCRDVAFEPRVYGAWVDDLLGLVRGLDPGIRSALIIGHNPGFEDLADRLVGGGDGRAVATLREGFPTGAFATLSVDGEWSDLADGDAHLRAFVRPRDLAG